MIVLSSWICLKLQNDKTYRFYMTDKFWKFDFLELNQEEIIPIFPMTYTEQYLSLNVIF